MTQQAQMHKKLPDTADMNLATFIKVVKKIDTAGHYFQGQQLWVRFDITEEQMSEFKEEYLNSVFAMYDATKRNFLRLLKRAK